jgi:hypothetical protein
LKLAIFGPFLKLKLLFYLPAAGHASACTREYSKLAKVACPPLIGILRVEWVVLRHSYIWAVQLQRQPLPLKAKSLTLER